MRDHSELVALRIIISVPFSPFSASVELTKKGYTLHDPLAPNLVAKL